MKTFILSLFLVIATFSWAMGVKSSDELKQTPSEFGDFLQENFADYLAESESWLRQNREFRSDDHEFEIAINVPFEKKPKGPTSKAVLFVHGLSDSPYSFRDVAERLSKEGYLVRSLLLPGHGGKPADLMLTEFEDWLALVSHHTDLLMQEFDEVWLGGFSTGANLAMIEAIDNSEVAGTLLFSPAFVSRKPLDFLAPLAKYVMDWADVDPEVSITRFDSLTMNGAALYYESSKLVRERLKGKVFDRPALITLSEGDSVINGEAIYSYFQDHFTHEHRQLLWFGEARWDNASVKTYSMDLPEKRISTGSHMAVLYAPDNPLYGEQGSIRICNNGQTEQQELECEAGADVWYSSFDHSEKEKIHARLTWNPYFDETLEQVISLLVLNR